MIPSSTLCRTQEDLHRRRAADTSLENVRLVANNAAAAWAKDTGLPLDVARYTVDQLRPTPVAIDAKIIAIERDTMNEFKSAGLITTQLP